MAFRFCAKVTLTRHMDVLPVPHHPTRGTCLEDRAAFTLTESQRVVWEMQSLAVVLQRQDQAPFTSEIDEGEFPQTISCVIHLFSTNLVEKSSVTNI